jgi:hypothetical protein
LRLARAAEAQAHGGPVELVWREAVLGAASPDRRISSPDRTLSCARESTALTRGRAHARTRVGETAEHAANRRHPGSTPTAATLVAATLVVLPGVDRAEAH